MRTLAAGTLFVLSILLANVVCAGVIMVLGPLAAELPEDLQVLAIIVIGVVAVGSALVFLNGCIRLALQPLFVVHVDPHKGLQSAASARGRGRSP